MVTKELTVQNAEGLHARPATLLVKKASSFKSDISIEFNGKTANVKSLIGVLSLGITKNSKFKLIVSGADEELASEEIAKLVASLS